MVTEANIQHHLGSLIGDFENALAGDKGSITEWNSLNHANSTIGRATDALSVEGLETDGWRLGEDSTFAAYEDILLHLHVDETAATKGIWASIGRKSNLDSILQALLPILSSNSPNEEISGEIAEIIGYDELELVPLILAHRQDLTEEIQGRFVHGDSKQEHGPNVRQDQSHRTESVFLNARERMEATSKANAHRPLFSGAVQPAPEILPNVYTSNIGSFAGGNILSQYGTKFSLPLGTTRESHQEYEEVVIPPARSVPPRATERLIPISELDQLAHGCFSAYRSLNRIQSIVYPVAYKTNENMLVCGKSELTLALFHHLTSHFAAPTGAGKTDVALLTILRVLNQYRSANPNVSLKDTIDRSAFKIIYIAPMKALASEITRKFGQRLRWLSISVRELTGDMQMTKAEIAQTQIIVTTPEKWDVVTRKPTGEGELASSIKLLILDEVHLLNDDRGAVIETVVARTLRQIESSQSIVRVVGLSATLPNYVDVAEFLSVSPYKGLFYFDSSFRPIPLEQHFIGIKGKTGSPLSKKNLDYVIFKKVSDLVQQGHQVMVFVHARKETVKTAMTLRETFIAEGNSELMSCEDHPQWSFFRREIGESRNKEMKMLFDSGLGIHNAGMLRSDRNIMERMFGARAIKVLCCTATLAWGVNLPAHAVIIKGTEIYDTSKGAFSDIGVLDVLQIFGRAGRPGLELSGEGYICTTEDKLPHYLDSVTSQIPIESKFQSGMIDALNAEISLGTVANTHDGVRWLGFTYLFVRMRKNPFIYGIDRNSLLDDPRLSNKRNELINQAARKLADARMIIFDQSVGELQVTDLGRIAAKYYIRYLSIEIFNKEFRPKMSEADVLAMLSMSTEFNQIQLRESEMKELEQLMDSIYIPCDVKGGLSTSAGKVNILLQAYISRIDTLNDFALISDMAYVAQNSGRIIRALLEISISRKWANVTATLLGLSKAIEKRLWPFDHPLEQAQLKMETLSALRRWCDDWSVAELRNSDAQTLGNLVHLNERQGSAIIQAAKELPSAQISYQLQPLASDILKISLVVKRTFLWNHKLHGTSEPFWVWVEDDDGLYICQLVHLVFHQVTDALDVDFVLPIPHDHIPVQLVVRWVSDRWIGAEEEVIISLQDLIMPPTPQCHSPLLVLPFLSLNDACNPQIASIFSGRISHFNSIQTQSFWSFMHSKTHALLCAPGGSGKTLFAEILTQTAILRKPGAWVIVVAPRKSIAQTIFADLRTRTKGFSPNVEYPTFDTLLSPPKKGGVYVVTATSLLTSLSRRPATPINGLDLVVCDGVEQLDATYELAISLLRLATQSTETRFIAFGDSLHDPSDLASWLNVGSTSLYSFRPRDREQSLKIHHHSFTVPHSAALFKAMAKPTHVAITRTSGNEPAIIFVPSRGQCRSIALDLITWSTLDSETAMGYLPKGLNEDDLQGHRSQLRNPELGDFIAKGVGFFHLGMDKQDRNIVLRLYAEGIIRILLVPREACWDLPVLASVVVVMGTQYVEIQQDTNLRRIRDYKLTDIVRMQSRAVRHQGTGHFYLFCQAEALDTYSRFLNEGLPLESQLMDADHLRVLIKNANSKGMVLSKQDIFDLLSFTFLARRIASNPAYYGFTSNAREENLSRIVDHLLSDQIPPQ